MKNEIGIFEKVLSLEVRSQEVHIICLMMQFARCSLRIIKVCTRSLGCLIVVGCQINVREGK